MRSFSHRMVPWSRGCRSDRECAVSGRLKLFRSGRVRKGTLNVGLPAGLLAWAFWAEASGIGFAFVLVWIGGLILAGMSAAFALLYALFWIIDASERPGGWRSLSWVGLGLIAVPAASFGVAFGASRMLGPSVIFDHAYISSFAVAGFSIVLTVGYIGYWITHVVRKKWIRGGFGNDP